MGVISGHFWSFLVVSLASFCPAPFFCLVTANGRGLVARLYYVASTVLPVSFFVFFIVEPSRCSGFPTGPDVFFFCFFFLSFLLRSVISISPTSHQFLSYFIMETGVQEEDPLVGWCCCRWVCPRLL